VQFGPHGVPHQSRPSAAKAGDIHMAERVSALTHGKWMTDLSFPECLLQKIHLHAHPEKHPFKK
jgi:hypothetical protein